MDVGGIVTTFLGLVSFLVLGTFLWNGKGAIFIAGYNLLPEKDKA